jgi:chromosome segregation ATPase
MGIDSSSDCISSHELKDAIAALEEERDALVERADEIQQQISFIKLSDVADPDGLERCENDLAEVEQTAKEWEAENGQYLTKLQVVADEVGDEVMVKESHWVDYVEELVKDIGDMPRNIPHYIVIDWDATADNIQQDYSSVEFEGVTYYYRST